MISEKNSVYLGLLVLLLTCVGFFIETDNQRNHKKKADGFILSESSYLSAKEMLYGSKAQRMGLCKRAREEFDSALAEKRSSNRGIKMNNDSRINRAVSHVYSVCR